MFFIGIFGISQNQKQLDYHRTGICQSCGRFGGYEVFYVYSYFHFFFLPLIKWNKKYYVKMNCCNSMYELNPEKGSAIARGESPELKAEDLCRINQGQNLFFCPECGFEVQKNFEFCPKCGKKLQ